MLETYLHYVTCRRSMKGQPMKVPYGDIRFTSNEGFAIEFQAPSLKNIFDRPHLHQTASQNNTEIWCQYFSLPLWPHKKKHTTEKKQKLFVKASAYFRESRKLSEQTTSGQSSWRATRWYWQKLPRQTPLPLPSGFIKNQNLISILAQLLALSPPQSFYVATSSSNQTNFMLSSAMVLFPDKSWKEDPFGCLINPSKGKWKMLGKTVSTRCLKNKFGFTLMK